MTMGVLTDDVRQVARRSVLCWLATADAHGQPSVSPKEVWAIVDDEHLVVAHIASPGSARSIRHNAQVCVSFLDIFVQKGFKVIGVATELTPSAPDFSTWAQPLQAMVGDRFKIHGVFVIRAKEVHPIVAPSYVFYPADTTEEAQVQSALRTYGVSRRNGGA